MIVRLLPVGDTTKDELAAISTRLRDALDSSHGVQFVTLLKTDLLGGSKGIASDVSAFLIGLPPSIISDAFKLIGTIVTRPGQPPAKIEITAASVKLEFNPGTVSLDDMALFVERIRSQALSS